MREARRDSRNRLRESSPRGWMDVWEPSSSLRLLLRLPRAGLLSLGDALEKCGNLSTLVLSNNKLTELKGLKLERHAQLRSLDLSHNALSSVAGASVRVCERASVRARASVRVWCCSYNKCVL